MTTGNIPENITFWSRGETKVIQKWDDLDSDSKEYIVRPAYVADSKNKKTNKTGEDWSKQTGYKTKILDPSKETLKNDPIDNVRVVCLEFRGQGGRAYKVIVNDKYFVDLREDVLLDAMLCEGIDVGGRLRGKYIFAVVGSQMKLIRINSALYDAVKKSTDMGKLKDIKTFEPGRIYSRKSGEYIYVGEFFSKKISYQRKIIDRRKSKAENLSFGSPEKYHLFFSKNYWDMIQNNSNCKMDSCYGFIVSKAPSFKESRDIEQGFVEKSADFVDIVRRKSEEYYRSEIKNGFYKKSILDDEYGIYLNLSSDPDYVNPVFKQ